MEDQEELRFVRTEASPDNEMAKEKNNSKFLSKKGFFRKKILEKAFGDEPEAKHTLITPITTKPQKTAPRRKGSTSASPSASAASIFFLRCLWMHELPHSLRDCKLARLSEPGVQHLIGLESVFLPH